MTDATEPPADAAENPEVDPEEQPPPFENRAARRAKGKPAANHVRGTGGSVGGRSGTVRSPRQYGNRRSG